MAWILGIVIVLLILAVFHLDSNYTRVRTRLLDLESRVEELEDSKEPSEVPDYMTEELGNYKD